MPEHTAWTPANPRTLPPDEIRWLLDHGHLAGQCDWCDRQAVTFDETVGFVCGACRGCNHAVT